MFLKWETPDGSFSLVLSFYFCFCTGEREVVGKKKGKEKQIRSDSLAASILLEAPGAAVVTSSAPL